MHLNRSWWWAYQRIYRSSLFPSVSGSGAGHGDHGGRGGGNADGDADADADASGSIPQQITTYPKGRPPRSNHPQDTSSDDKEQRGNNTDTKKRNISHWDADSSSSELDDSAADFLDRLRRETVSVDIDTMCIGAEDELLGDGVDDDDDDKGENVM
jgi:hypothetical protein